MVCHQTTSLGKPPQGSVRPILAELVRTVQLIGQIGAMLASPATPAPLMSIPSLAGPGRTILVNFEPPYTTKSYNEPPYSPSMPKGVLND